MRNLLTAWQDNPVIINELRSRMRGKRAYLILAGHLFILSALVLIIYLIVYQETQGYRNYYYGGGFQQMLEASATMGKAVFYGSSLLLLFIVSLVGPAFTAGAIASERDHQTLDLLTITALPPKSIVLGKLNAVLVFMGLLILAILPFQSMAYFFGGVEVWEILISTLILLLTTLLFCSLGIFVSSFARSVTIANMINYAAVIPMLLGVPFLTFFMGVFTGGMFFERYLDSAPLVIIGGITYIILFLLSINPLSMAVTSEVFIQETGSYFFSVERFFDTDVPIIAPWIIYVFFALIMSLVLIKAAIHRIGRVDRV